MVALGVLIILVGGIFLVVQTSLKTVLMIDNNASRADEITNLTDILRGGFRNLPAQARLIAQPLQTDGINQYLIIVQNAPGFLTWMSEPESERMTVVLALRQDGKDSSWRMCLKRFVPSKAISDGTFDAKTILKAGAKIPWLELVRDFRSVNTRFFDAASGTWKDRWEDPTLRPSLIEFTLVTEQVRDPRSETKVLWVPPVKGGST
jgi:hypothetical protein